MPLTVPRLACLAVLAGGSVAALSCAGSLAPEATVRYAIDAPLCSSQIPVQFSIDNVLVGEDTFLVNLGPGHTMSRGFGTTAGPHTLSARVVGGFIWPDRAVTIATGEVYTHILPFYCS